MLGRRVDSLRDGNLVQRSSQEEQDNRRIRAQVEERQRQAEQQQLEATHRIMTTTNRREFSLAGGKYDTDLSRLAQMAVREVEREAEDEEVRAMGDEDTRLKIRTAEINRQRGERTKMMKEDKPPKISGRGRGRRD